MTLKQQKSFIAYVVVFVKTISVLSTLHLRNNEICAQQHDTLNHLFVSIDSYNNDGAPSTSKRTESRNLAPLPVCHIYAHMQHMLLSASIDYGLVLRFPKQDQHNNSALDDVLTYLMYHKGPSSVEKTLVVFHVEAQPRGRDRAAAAGLPGY
jgi:hypothetical protein